MSNVVLTTDEAFAIAQKWDSINWEFQKWLLASVEELRVLQPEQDFKYHLKRMVIETNGPHRLHTVLDDMIGCYFETTSFKSMPSAEVMKLRGSVMKACQVKLEKTCRFFDCLKPSIQENDDCDSSDDSGESLKSLISDSKAWERHLKAHRTIEQIQLGDSERVATLPAVSGDLSSRPIFHSKRLRDLKASRIYNWPFIAKKMKMTETTVKNHAFGRSQPDRETVEKYADLFDEPFDTFWLKP